MRRHRPFQSFLRRYIEPPRQEPSQREFIRLTLFRANLMSITSSRPYGLPEISASWAGVFSPNRKHQLFSAHSLTWAFLTMSAD